MWLNIDGGDALTSTSSQCLQYTLVPGTIGTANFDGDACGDLAGGTSFVPLDTLFFICPGGGATSLKVSSCVAWSQQGADRICPVPDASGQTRFRYGSTPSGKSKCNCEELDIPVQVEEAGAIASQPSVGWEGS